MQVPRNSPGGRLFVQGSIQTGDKLKYSLGEVNLQGMNPHELILEITPDPGYGEQVCLLTFGKDLDREGQYISIRIRIGGREDMKISKIEISR